MQTHTKPLFLLFVVIAVSVAVVATARTQDQKRSSEGIQPKTKSDEVYGHYPTVDYSVPESESTDPQKRAKRLAKNSRYNELKVVSGIPRRGAVRWGYHWNAGLSEIPVDKSDAIVVGEVLDKQAHLSNNKKAVYSEFTVRVDEVLKNSDTTPIDPGGSITVDRFGGAVRYDSDHTALYHIIGQGIPQVGNRYVFFLKMGELDQDYAIVTGYELSGDHVFPLDSIQQSGRYAGMDKSVFLQKVKGAVAKP